MEEKEEQDEVKFKSQGFTMQELVGTGNRRSRVIKQMERGGNGGPFCLF